MQQKAPLYAELDKLSNGDLSGVDNFCSIFSDRLIYVPVIESAGSGSGSEGVTVKVVRLDSDGEQRVGIFTAERFYKNWSVNYPEKTNFISLLGGDFCAALAPETYVVIDPGAKHSVRLGDEIIDKIIALAPAEEIDEGKPTPVMLDPHTFRGRSDPTSFMARPKIPSVSQEVSAFGAQNDIEQVSNRSVRRGGANEKEEGMLKLMWREFLKLIGLN